jgi:hypothetical protein
MKRLLDITFQIGISVVIAEATFRVKAFEKYDIDVVKYINYS